MGFRCRINKYFTTYREQLYMNDPMQFIKGRDGLRPATGGTMEDLQSPLQSPV